MSTEAMSVEDTLKLALEALRKAMQGNLVFDEAMDAFKVLEEALAKQEQSATRGGEPVAWRTYTGRGYYIIDPTLEEAQKNWPDRTHQPLYTTPQPKQEQSTECGGEPVGYAGVKVWVGDQQVCRVLTQTELHYAISPWQTIEMASMACISALKENI